MGCSASTLEDEEAVQLCKDRRNFIKQAVEQRIRFASGHIAYIQSLKRVSHALRDFVDGDEHNDSFSDSFTTPPFTPVKRFSPEIIGIPFKSSSASALNQSEKSMGVPLKSSASTLNQSEKSTLHISRYLRSGGTSSVSVEECPQPAETARINSYYTVDHYGSDGYFATQASPLNSSFFSSTYDRPSYPPASPQNSQWDSFWNPFTSLDTYGFPPYQSSLDQMISDDDDIAGLRQVREEEGIPELEEEGAKGDQESVQLESQNERHKVNSNHIINEDASEDSSEAKIKGSKVHQVREFQSKHVDRIEVSETKDVIELKITKEKEVGRRESTEETPGFTVYLNRRPTSLAEIMKDIESQFMRICDCAHEVSLLLEASRAQYSSTSNEIAVKMMNPVALFRSTSSRSSSSRFFHASCSSGYDGYESSSDYSDESCMISGSHQSTLDRLYEWEKKLYEEVKAGERIRIAFEKKYKQMRKQDVQCEEPSAVGKTRATVRDLHTQLKVSIHSVESVSKRIETLRDEELHPQLIDLIQGLAKMWRTTAECHRLQKRTIDEAKLLILSFAAAGKISEEATPPRHPRSAAALEAELRNWRACLEAWVAAQRAYATALAGWALRCGDPASGARSPLSPRRSSSGAPPVLGVCVQWSRLLESVGEAQVVDGLDFFAAGIGSVSGRAAAEEGEGEDGGAATAEMARRVLCAGMSVAVSSLAEFAARSAEGYEVLGRRGGERRAEP